MHTRILIMTDTPEEFKKKFLDASWYRVQPAKNAKQTREDHRKVFLLDEFPSFDITEKDEEEIKLFFYIGSNEEVKANSKWFYTASCVMSYEENSLTVCRYQLLESGFYIKSAEDFKRVSEIVHNFNVYSCLRDRLQPSPLNPDLSFKTIKPFNFLE